MGRGKKYRIAAGILVRGRGKKSELVEGGGLCLMIVGMRLIWILESRCEGGGVGVAVLSLDIGRFFWGDEIWGYVGGKVRMVMGTKSWWVWGGSRCRNAFFVLDPKSISDLFTLWKIRNDLKSFLFPAKSHLSNGLIDMIGLFPQLIFKQRETNVFF